MQLNIAILGTRGIPNHYGGFEYVAGQLAKELVQRNHRVTVYNSHRHPYREKEWEGVNIVHCFDPEYLIGVPGQFVYDMNCIRDARKKNYDIILMLGYTSSSVWGFLYPKKTVVITNMDGLEWLRTKYSAPVKRFLKYAEKLAVRPGRYYIADSPVIKEYLEGKYHIHAEYIAYGAERRPPADESLLQEYDLKRGDYFFLMARLEPENNIEMILDGYCLAGTHIKFIVTGNTNNRFGKYLLNKYKSNSRIFFTGAVYDEAKVQSLTAFCRLYFHGHSVGGTNPSLLAAMAERAPIAAHDNAFNRSVLKENASFFSNTEQLRGLLSSDEYSNEAHIRNNFAAIEKEFTWPAIADRYEDHFLTCYRATH